jgi:prophage regulatory protein
MKFADDRIILAPERRNLVPYSDMHIWRMERAQTFPKRIKLGPNRVGWSLLEVRAWIEARKAERECPTQGLTSAAHQTHGAR